MRGRDTLAPWLDGCAGVLLLLATPETPLALALGSTQSCCKAVTEELTQEEADRLLSQVPTEDP